MIYTIISLYKSRTIFFRSWKPHVNLVEKFIIFPYRYVPAWKFSLWKRSKLEFFLRFLNTVTRYVGKMIISTRVKWSYCTSVRRSLEYTNSKSTGQSHPYRETNKQLGGREGNGSDHLLTQRTGTKPKFLSMDPKLLLCMNVLPGDISKCPCHHMHSFHMHIESRLSL